MSRNIGVVYEGPTDFLVIKSVVDKITQDENVYLSLQPDESLAGSLGNGWKGVWRWCESHGIILHDYMTKVTPRLDCLIIHMDGDVSRKEKETHCDCTLGFCEQAGVTHPLICPVCKAGQCPVALPCQNHVAGYAAHLHSLVSSWLRISDESPPVIITIPCDSVDTWVAVAYGDLGNECEAHPNPWDSIIACGAYYHSIRIQGHKKRVTTYQALADHVSENWGIVRERCPQAKAFELAIQSSLPEKSIPGANSL